MLDQVCENILREKSRNLMLKQRPEQHEGLRTTEEKWLDLLNLVG